MRWGIAVLLVLLLFLAYAHGSSASLPAWGCCATDTAAGCFDGSIIGYQGTFNNFVDRCMESLLNVSLMPGDPQSRMFVSSNYVLDQGGATCANQRKSGALCELGCCCNDAENPKSGEETTRRYCSLLALEDPVNRPRSFQPNPTGRDCDQLCSGSTLPPGGATYQVSGRVVRKDTTQALPRVKVSASYRGSPNTATARADGTFTLPAGVAAGTLLLVTDPQAGGLAASCRGQKYVDVSGDTDVTIEVDCSTSSCANQAPTADLTQDAGSNSVTIKLSAIEACGAGSLQQYMIRRCERTGGVLNLSSCMFISQTASMYTAAGLKDNTEYCFSVNATFSVGAPAVLSASGFGVDAPTCITTGASNCMTPGAARQWCGAASGAPARFYCTAENRVDAQPCTGSEICVESGSGASTTASCIAAPACQSCNGLLGLFSKLPLRIPFRGTVSSCASLSGGATAPAARCYKDDSLAGAPTLLPVYGSCAQVMDCAAYSSPATCKANPCQVRSGAAVEACSWVQLNAELGTGVCTGAGRPACALCNKLGGCTEDLCMRINSTDCYYDDDANDLDVGSYPEGFPRCIPKSEMACRYYDTQEDCAGGAGIPALYDIQYAGGAPAGGTHQLLRPSADRFGFGACTWVETRCIKDADNDRNPQNEDDCIESGIYAAGRPECVRDMAPPTTTFTLRNPAKYGKHELRSLPFTVIDGMVPAEGIVTRVCFSAAGSLPCYPTQPIGAVNLTDITNETYTMRYYSADIDGNFEPVKELSIEVVDLGYATLDSVEIRPNT